VRLSRLRRGQERYYLATVASGAEDHRPPGVEPDGVWSGQGARGLGLAGRVEAAPLAAVLDGAHPATGERLSPTHGGVRVVGLDLTFAAPKQVSLLFGLGSPRTAREAAAGHEAAVGASIGYLERRALWARRQRDGERWAVPTEGAVAASFLHRTSRLLDPHLHTHVLVANLVQTADGRFSALDTRSLYAHATVAGCLYGAHLRAELSRRLGVEFVADAQGRFMVSGMDPGLSRAFSRRRLQVEAQLEAWQAAGEAAARAAALATRPQKNLESSVEDLFHGWQERARGMGMEAEGVDRFVGRPTPAVPRHAALVDLAAGLAAPSGPLSSAPAFSRAELVEAMCRALPAGAEVAALEAAADAVLASDLVVGWGDSGVGPGRPFRLAGRSWSPGGPGRWATQVRARAEEATLARAMSRATEPAVANRDLVQAAVALRPGLSAAEQAAVERLATTTGGVVVLVGEAAARHDVLDAAREVWEKAGRRVVGLGLSREQAAELEAVCGIPSSGPPFAQIREAGGRAGRDTVVVAVGAERADLGDLEWLLSATDGATLVLAGSRGGPDSPLARLRTALGAVELSTPSGGAEAWAARPWPSLGDAVTVSFAEGAAVVFHPSAGAARARMVGDWLAGSQSGQAPAMVAGPAEARRLNALARSSLSALGALGGTVVDGPRPLAAGDRVVARWGSARSGLAGGQAATVEGREAGDRHLRLRTEDGEVHEAPLSDVRRGQLAYAYALTPADAGRAAPSRLLVLGSASSLEQVPTAKAATELRYYAVAGPDLRLGGRASLLGRAAEVAAPASLLERLGPVPGDSGARAAWRRAASALAAYRERWGEDLADSRLGAKGRRLSAVQVADRADALAELRAARHRLGADLEREPVLLRGAARAPGLERGELELESPNDGLGLAL
jgi:conjugative relaxase-like TrwC/TraI family protein